MKNIYRLSWSAEAISGLKEIINYLERKFSEKEVKKFVQKFDKQMNLIERNPEIFPISSKSKIVRRAIVANLTSIFYLIEGDEIKIISVYDNRKDPKKLKI